MDALDTYLTAEIIKALGEGNLTKFAANIAIFALLWVQLRGLKKELHSINVNISKSFADGEARFGKIEKQQALFEQRLAKQEQLNLPKGTV